MKKLCHKKEEIKRIWISTTDVRDVFTTSVIDLAVGVITKKIKRYHVNELLRSGLMFITP